MSSPNVIQNISYNSNFNKSNFTGNDKFSSYNTNGEYNLSNNFVKNNDNVSNEFVHNGKILDNKYKFFSSLESFDKSTATTTIIETVIPTLNSNSPKDAYKSEGFSCKFIKNSYDSSIENEYVYSEEEGSYSGNSNDSPNVLKSHIPLSLAAKESPDLSEENAAKKSNTSHSSIPSSSRKKEGVKFSDEVKWDTSNDGKPLDLNLLFKAINKIDVIPKKAPLKNPNLGSCRKNMSFNNTEVRKIDQENKRLLNKIVSQQTRSQPKFSAAHSGPRLTSSAINRQRKQRQIELENLALLKRLESARPSKMVNRVQLLREYDSLSNTPCGSSRPSSGASSRMTPSSSRPTTASTTVPAASGQRRPTTAAPRKAVRPPTAKSAAPTLESSHKKKLHLYLEK